MGNQSSTTSILSSKQLISSLQKQIPLSARKIVNTQVHQIYSSSPQHHELILRKLRIKKQFDCPHLIRIIDSHTVESQNLCSTMIKTYIVIEKPKSLMEIMQDRIDKKETFSEGELINIMIGCTEGLLFLAENNIPIKRLNINRIFMDDLKIVKIMDPQFVESSINLEESEETEIVKNLGNIVKNMTEVGKISGTYSSQLWDLLNKIQNQSLNFMQLRRELENIREFESSKQSSSIRCSDFSKKYHKTFLNSCNHSCNHKKSLTVTSNKSQTKSNCSYQTSKHSVKPCKNLKIKPSNPKIVKKFNQENKENCLQIKNHNIKRRSQIAPKSIDQNIGKICKTQVEMSHCFPVKANLRQRKPKNINQSCMRQKHRTQYEEQQNGGDNLITYHIDKQTSISEVSREQPGYLIDLLDKTMSNISQRDSERPRFSQISINSPSKALE